MTKIEGQIAFNASMCIDGKDTLTKVVRSPHDCMVVRIHNGAILITKEQAMEYFELCPK